ncbi:MAG TPA: sugar transferase [Aliiroseovarius sp.]|nr:sugar transferase [Aliiroseovarius sp.]
MTVHYRQTFPAVEVGDISPPKLRYRHRSGFYRDGGKRILDIVLVLILAIPTLILMLIVLPLVALDGASPLYRQERIGRNGRIFKIWKVRSMVPDADQKLAAYLKENPQARLEWDHHQKLRNDPRITRLGRLIRRTSIDELPQLLNVLLGDMSLVGPRPMMTCQRDIYPGKAYYEIRPGITGAWQVSDRHETSFAERALFDTTYYASVSASTDLSIMLRTIAVVFKAAGA